MNHSRFFLRVLSLSVVSLLFSNRSSAADQLTLEVRETAGIRRFGYPVAAELRLDPPVPVATQFRLLHDGKPIVAQFRPIQLAGDKIAVMALDFDSNFVPLETREYVVEFGPDVTPPPEPSSGMKVEETAETFVVSHGPNLTWTIPKDLRGLIRSVKTSKTDYLRTDSVGLTADGKPVSARIAPTGQPTSEIVRQGPIHCALRFENQAVARSDQKIGWRVELDFPRSKSWVRVTWTEVDFFGTRGRLESDLNLAVGAGPTLVDFGVDDLVYAAVPAGQVAVLEADGTPPRNASDARNPRRLWATYRGPADKPEPYVLGLITAKTRIDGWAHVMDRERCTAVAVDGFGRETYDRIEVSADGRLRISRDFMAQTDANKPTTRQLRFWLHFVPFPPHVGAVTSPQSMQSPLEVTVKAERRKRTAETQKKANGDAEPAARAALENDVNALRARCRAALAKTNGELRLAGLKDKVEVLRDKWGVPHIYAQNRHDLFFAQGFVQAQDRLWQLEIWRRTTEGRLAEIVGPEAVERDRFARLIRYRGDMEAEWTSYSPDAKSIIEAFVRGVNAFIETSRDNPPIEFQLTGIKPELWTPEVCIGRMAGFIMCRNASNEILRAQLVRELGAEQAARLLPIDPFHELTVPDGLDLDGIDHRVAAGLTTTSATVKVPLADSERATSKIPRDHFIGDSTLLTLDPPLSALDSFDIGSNNWTIAGRLTTTGKPILANDPHRPITLPSLRYIVHLNCPPRGEGKGDRSNLCEAPSGPSRQIGPVPFSLSERGWNVIGGTEPALPGVAIGHNERIAWGMTIVGTDQMDIYVEDTHPDDANRYRVGDGWQPMRVERERIHVRGVAEPREVELKFTRHGPVIFEDPQRHRAYALRWTGSEPGSAGYLAALAVDRAANWNEYLQALARWKVPGLNLVYADVDGHIGWVATAATPVRRGWDGLLPVPGASGKFEWDGFLPVADLPQRFDPPEGYIATANHNILPPGYRREISYEWSAPFRFGRIDEVFRRQIEAGRKFSTDDSQRLQHDATSIPARRLVTLLRTVAEKKDSHGSLIDERQLRWDGVLARDSAAAALFEVWQRRLTERVLKPRVPEQLWVRYSGRIPLQVALDLLERPDASFGSDPIAARDALLIETLAEATQEVKKLLGDDPTAWRWGALHQAHFRHMLATQTTNGGGQRAAKPTGDAMDHTAIAAVLNLPSVPRDGDANTPLAAGGPAFGRFDQATGASFRQVIDLADWDRSVASSVPGQSGQPESPHYGDLLPLWADGNYFPLPFTRGAVEAATTDRLILLPAP